MLTEQQLRIYALERAIAIEGAKAVTSEVIEAAERIFEFLIDAESAPARTMTN
jgi:hypothetical protein